MFGITNISTCIRLVVLIMELPHQTVIKHRAVCRLFESGTAIERLRRSPSAVVSARVGGLGALPHENLVIKDD